MLEDMLADKASAARRQKGGDRYVDPLDSSTESLQDFLNWSNKSQTSWTKTEKRYRLRRKQEITASASIVASAPPSRAQSPACPCPRRPNKLLRTLSNRSNIDETTDSNHASIPAEAESRPSSRGSLADRVRRRTNSMLSSIRPTIGMEPHPVFVQPTKRYSINRFDMVRRPTGPGRSALASSPITHEIEADGQSSQALLINVDPIEADIDARIDDSDTDISGQQGMTALEYLAETRRRSLAESVDSMLL